VTLLKEAEIRAPCLIMTCNNPGLKSRSIQATYQYRLTQMYLAKRETRRVLTNSLPWHHRDVTARLSYRDEVGGRTVMPKMTAKTAALLRLCMTPRPGGICDTCPTWAANRGTVQVGPINRIRGQGTELPASPPNDADRQILSDESTAEETYDGSETVDLDFGRSELEILQKAPPETIQPVTNPRKLIEGLALQVTRILRSNWSFITRDQRRPSGYACRSISLKHEVR
jgi:hypothetical protein